MDTIAQKYSVFDFFNLLIAGAVSLCVLAICQYPKSIVFLEMVAEYTGNSGFLSFVLIVTYAGCSLICGMVLQVAGHYLIKEKMGWQTKLISKCLNGKGIFENSYRTSRVFQKAIRFLNIKDTKTELSKEETSAFFAYCVYYLHVRRKDEKTEKLRETQGLSELFACVFWITPMFSIIISIIQVVIWHDMNFNISCIVSASVISVMLGFVFYHRYKISCCNRIRMVLSIYDACSREELF